MPRETLLTILKRWVGETAGEEALYDLQNALAADPSLIEELAPGKVLKSGPMTTVERAQKAAQASIARRQAKAAERNALVIPAIKRMLRRKPDITPIEIARGLDAESIPAPQGSRWNPITVQRLIDKEGLR